MNKKSKFKQQFQLECHFQCIIILKFGEHGSLLRSSAFRGNPLCVFKPAHRPGQCLSVVLLGNPTSSVDSCVASVQSLNGGAVKVANPP